METKVSDIQNRLEALEEKSRTTDGLGANIDETQSTAGCLAIQNNLLQSRIDELEDRSRGNNLFYGLPDSKETWPQTETQLTTVIECAHRLGNLSQDKCRPVILKFTNFKVKVQVLSARKLFKTKNIAVSEDFCPATRIVRKNISEFAKNQPDSPPFLLSYNKLTINKKRYIYNATNGTIEEIATSENTEPHEHAPAAASVSGTAP